MDEHTDQATASGVRLGTMAPSDVVRVPDPAGPSWERALAAANARSVEAARASLRADFSGFEEVAATTWGDRPRMLASDRAPIPAVALDDLFDRVIGDHHVPPERLVTFDHQTPLPNGALGDQELAFSILRPQPTLLANLVAGGGGVVLQSVAHHDADLVAALDRWDRALGMHTQLDLALVGAEGAKQPPDRNIQLVSGFDGPVVVEAAALPPALGERASMPVRHEMPAGTWLLVPPGWGFAVRSSVKVTLAVVLTIPTVPLHNLAGLSLIEAVQWPRLRGYVPYDRSAPHEHYAGSIYEEGLDGTVAELVSSGAAERGLAKHLSTLAGRWRGSLGTALRWHVDPETVTAVRCPLPGGIHVGRPEHEDEVCLHAGGRKVFCPPEVAELLGAVADGQVHQVGARDRDGGDQPLPAELRAALLDLIRVGFLEAADR